MKIVLLALAGILFNGFASFCQVNVLDSTTHKLRAYLANYYYSKKIEQSISFYSPVYVHPVIVSPIIVTVPKTDIAQYRLSPNQPIKFDAWGKTKFPLYMQPNRYDWMSKAKENERH